MRHTSTTQSEFIKAGCVNHTLVKLVPCRHHSLTQLVIVIDAMLVDLSCIADQTLVYRIQVWTVWWPECGWNEMNLSAELI